jgi:hypothetical protein
MATETLRPTGAGTNTELTKNGGTTNWGNNADDNDATTVKCTGTSYKVDTYAIGNSAIPAGSTINSVTVRVRYAEFSQG